MGKREKNLLVNIINQKIGIESMVKAWTQEKITNH